MKKRLLIPILSLLLASIFLCGCGNKYTDGLTFNFYEGEDGFCSVSGGGKKTYTTVKLPDIYEGWIINRIDQDAFSGCSNLSQINVPSNVIIVSAGAFRNCTSLTKIDLPVGLKAIGAESFLNSGLTQIIVPDITELGTQAFALCVRMETVEFSDSLEVIQERAFSACIRLKSVYLPKSLTSIELGAFENCVELSAISLPYGLETIAPRAFYGCASLTSLTIPKSVTSIGDSAFAGCTSLTSVTLNCDFEVSYSSFNFAEIPDGITFSVPESLLEQYKSAEGWSAVADKIFAIESAE